MREVDGENLLVFNLLTNIIDLHKNMDLRIKSSNENLQDDGKELGRNVYTN